MCTLNPFSALRPAAGKVADVASHSVERYSKDDIKHILASNPVSFLQVINPLFLGKQSGQNMEEHLFSIKNNLQEFTAKNIFTRETSPCFYIYRQIKNGRHHTGIIGLASVEDYNNDLIKIHEQTLAQREEKLKEYLDVCEFNAEPVCLTYPHHTELNAIMQVKITEPPVYDYTRNAVKHTVWIVNKPEEIERIQLLFENIPYIYIADGHHRAASSARLAEMRKNSNPNHTGNELYNFFMAALFADDELTIFSYNRLVKTLSGHTTVSFLDELKKNFPVSLPGQEYEQPPHKNIISLYLDRNWYTINIERLKKEHNDPVSNLDVSILSTHILSPILGIKDLRNDSRIKFIPGVKSRNEIEKAVDSGKTGAAFCLFPVSFEELILVAGSGKEMPPKSTWIEPKLESGLLIYTFYSNSHQNLE